MISRWENGRTSPDHESVVRAVLACGFDLEISLVPHDEHDLALIRREMTLLPHQRLARMVKAVNTFNLMEKAGRD